MRHLQDAPDGHPPFSGGPCDRRGPGRRAQPAAGGGHAPCGNFFHRRRSLRPHPRDRFRGQDGAGVGHFRSRGTAAHHPSAGGGMGAGAYFRRGPLPGRQDRGVWGPDRRPAAKGRLRVPLRPVHRSPHPPAGRVARICPGSRLHLRRPLPRGRNGRRRRQPQLVKHAHIPLAGLRGGGRGQRLWRFRQSGRERPRRRPARGRGPGLRSRPGRCRATGG